MAQVFLMIVISIIFIYMLYAFKHADKEKQNNKMFYLLIDIFIAITALACLIMSMSNRYTNLSESLLELLFSVLLPSAILALVSFFFGTIWLVRNIIKEKMRRIPLIIMTFSAGVFMIAALIMTFVKLFL